MQEKTATFTDILRAAAVTSFGCGLSPVAPGTIGTLPAVALYVFISLVFPGSWHLIAVGVLFLVSCGLSLLLGPWAEQWWGEKDPSPFVLDEFASFFMTVLLFQGQGLFVTTLWAFGATRFFDILKPPPARQIEQLPGGWGMLLDDLVASIYAALLLNILLQSFPAIMLLPYDVVTFFLRLWL